MKALVLGSMLVLVGSLAACSSSGSDDGSGSGSGSGSGGSGSGSGTGTDTGTGSGTGPSTGTGPTTGSGPTVGPSTGTGPTTGSGPSGPTTTSTGPGGGICTSGLTTGDATADACLSDACCQEHLDCTANGTDPDSCIACFEAGGGPLCDAAIACGEASGCGGDPGGGICTSGLTVGDPATDQCLGDNCCQEFLDCTADGTDPDSCIACFEAGGGPLCDAASACFDEFCSGSGGGICTSGLTVGDPEADACLSDNCCQEFLDCTADGTDPDSCIACFEAGGGPLCDEALACSEEFCSDVGGGGICESGLTSGDPATDTCLSDNCCQEHLDCTADGTDVDACIACFEAGGGPLCDEAIACGEEFCAG